MKRLNLNKMLLLYVSIVVFIFFGVLYSIFEIEWLMIPVWIALSYVGILGILMIVYAWIINPIKRYLDAKKD